MSTINIDNKDYDFDTLSEEAKNQLRMIQICDQEIGRLEAGVAITRTARGTYSQALAAALPASALGDTIKFQ